MIAAPSLVLDAGQWAGALTAVLGFAVLIQQIVKRTIVGVVKPLIDEVKAASKAQHDEQNLRLDKFARDLEGLKRRNTRKDEDD